MLSKQFIRRTKMKVLIACEFSGIVRDAFIEGGHDAVSCDLLDTEKHGPHLKCDISRVLTDEWDIMIAFPPCTYLCASGARWWVSRKKEQKQSINFVKTLMDAPIRHIAIENPIGILSSVIRKPDQIIQPWQFGHGETKSTCLWLKNLPKLIPTNVVKGRNPRCHHESPSKERWKNRSRTYSGIANAMAEQWGGY